MLESLWNLHVQLHMLNLVLHVGSGAINVKCPKGQDWGKQNSDLQEQHFLRC